MAPLTLVAHLLGTLAGAAPAAGRPNILWLTAEDMSPSVASFGDTYAVTPHIDRLAAQGVRYTHAFAASGVCAPSRSSIILGLHASSAGSQHMRSRVAIPASLRLYSQLLRAAGYHATNNAKEDYNLARTPADAWDDSSPRAHWRGRRDRGQPFFAIFNFTTSHEGQIRAPDADHARRVAGFAPHERHDPAAAPLPPYHPDTPEVRRDWARYADNVTAMDRQVGEILRQLDEDGLSDSTIVFFYSDHGAGMPRSKRWLYDSGLRVPLVVRFPKRWAQHAPGPPGSVTDRLVSLVDMGPTALSLAGVPVPAAMQGQPFLGPHARPPRSHVFGFRDRMDERYDLTRSVRDRRYLYLRNYLPHRPWAQHIDYMFEMPTMRVWQRLHAEGKLRGPERRFFEPKPHEELYDTWADPHNVHDLAADPQHNDVLARMRGTLDRWMLEVRDSGLLPEAEMHARAEGSTPYEMVRDPARYDLPRVMEAAAVAARRDPRQAARLTALLGDRDSAIRYWAATGLAALGTAAGPGAAALRRALADPSPSVRIAAAEALAGLGRTREALAALEEALASPREPVRLHAANVLDLLGDRARPIVPSLRKTLALEPRDSYPRRVLPRLLDRLGAAP